MACLQAKLPTEKIGQVKKNYCYVKNLNFLARWAIYILQEVIIWLCYFAILPQLGTEKGGREAVHWDTVLHLYPVTPPLYLSLGQWCRQMGPCTEPMGHSQPEKSNSLFNMDRTISCRCSFSAFGLFWWWDKRQRQNRQFRLPTAPWTSQEALQVTKQG